MYRVEPYKEILAALIVRKVYEKYCRILPNIETQYEGDVKQVGDSVIIRFKGNFLTQVVMVGDSCILKVPFEQIDGASQIDLVNLSNSISDDIVLRLAQEKEKDIFVFQCIPDKHKSEQDSYVLVWTAAKKKPYTILWNK